MKPGTIKLLNIYLVIVEIILPIIFKHILQVNKYYIDHNKNYVKLSINKDVTYFQEKVWYISDWMLKDLTHANITPGFTGDMLLIWLGNNGFTEMNDEELIMYLLLS